MPLLFGLLVQDTRSAIMKKIFQVALDGPGGAGTPPLPAIAHRRSPRTSGKSSVAKVVAERLGLLYVDSGSMYRAVTLHCLYASRAACVRNLDFLIPAP